MKSQSIVFVIAGMLLLNSCASPYKTIDPPKLSYASGAEDNGVKFEYKYNLLSKRYAVRESKNGVKLVAVKFTNNSGRDLIFGKNIRLFYANNNNHELAILDEGQIFDATKQNVGVYLLYLLLTPLKLYTASNGEQTSSTPIGYVLGPGLALGNAVAAGSANDNLHKELDKYNLMGKAIKNGETSYGLIGIKADGFDAIKVKVDNVVASSGQ